MGEPAGAPRPTNRGSVLAIFGIALLVPISAVAFLVTHGGRNEKVDLNLSNPCAQLDTATLARLAPGAMTVPTESGSSTSAVRHCTADSTGRDVEIDVQADGRQFTGPWRAARCADIDGDPQRSNGHVVCRSQRRDGNQSRLDSYTWVGGVYQVHVTYQRVPADQVPDDVVAAFDGLVAKVVAALPAGTSG